MTARRLTKRRAVLERHKDEVIALVLDGKSDPEIAAKYSCRRESVYLFRERHKAELSALMLQVGDMLIGVALANKQQRVVDADTDYQRLGQVIEARAADTRYDEPGYSSGLMVHEVKALGGGENVTFVDQYKVDTAVIAERRALRRAVAEEMDQLPKGNGDTINDNRTQILVRQVIGYDPSALG